MVVCNGVSEVIHKEKEEFKNGYIKIGNVKQVEVE